MSEPGATLTPPRARGRASVVKLERQWFVACAADELSRRPIARTVQGMPLVLFRGEGGAPAALLDRCAHRNVPLSLGRAVGGQVECIYHGWRFDGGGACRAVPGLCAPAESEARRVPWFAARQLDGWIWVYSTPEVTGEGEPFRFPFLDDRRYTIVRRHMPVRSTMHAAIENALDVPHTAFLHGGLFRTSRKRNEIEVLVRRGEDRVEVEYLGEPRPSGLAGRMLLPGGGTVMHVDRFVLPCVVQVEYGLGTSTHLVATSAFTPVTDFETHLYATVAFRLPLPGAVVRPVLQPIVLRILHQDARILAEQTDAVIRFGGEQYAHTDIDMVGPYVWHLLRQAERGEKGEARDELVRRRMIT